MIDEIYHVTTKKVQKSLDQKQDERMYQNSKSLNVSALLHHQNANME